VEVRHPALTPGFACVTWDIGGTNVLDIFGGMLGISDVFIKFGVYCPRLRQRKQNSQITLSPAQSVERSEPSSTLPS
jgi:hypothetical protein